jgi:vacuolar-type H+-ATPase subunit I/STV1
MSPAKTPTTTPDKLALEINLLNEQVIQSRNQTLIYAARAGAKMLEAKQLVGYGNFIKWLQDNVTITREYATNYMKLAKEYPQLLNDQTANQSAIQSLDVTKAIALITAPDDVKQTVMLSLENGETVTVSDIKKLKQQAAQLANANDINAELSENLNAKQKELDSVENQLDDLIKDGGIDRIIEQKETETQVIIGEMAQRQDQLKDQISRLKNEQEKTIQQRVDAELAKRKNDIANLEAQKTTLNHDYINNGFKSAAIILIDQIQAFWALIERNEQQAAKLDIKTINAIVTASNESKMLSAKLEDIATQTLENTP